MDTDAHELEEKFNPEFLISAGRISKASGEKKKLDVNEGKSNPFKLIKEKIWQRKSLTHKYVCAPYKLQQLPNVLQNSNIPELLCFWCQRKPIMTWVKLSCNKFEPLEIEKYDVDIYLFVLTACLVFNSERACMCVAVERGGLSETEALGCCLKCRRALGWGNCVWRAVIMMRRRSDQILCL